MTGIEMMREWANELREAARAYRDGEIGYVPIDVEACQRKNAARLDAIANQIEREIEEAVADEVADTLSAYEMNINARWYSAVEDGADSDCKTEYEMINRYWLPRPRFEDGESVQVGDKYVNKYGNVATADTVVVSNHGFTLYDKGSATHFKLTESVKRPEPPKVLDADGVEIKVGDEVWEVEDGIDPLTVVEINGERVIGKLSSVLLVAIHCSKVTHKRPEPPDTWERLTADIERCGDSCAYFGRNCDDGGSACKGCPCHGADDACMVIVMRDVLGRAKKLAGVE